MGFTFSTRTSQGAWEAAACRLDGSAWRGLLLVCPEQHAMQVILHVGEPDTERRRVPAALLSVPTQLTRPQTVQVAAQQAIHLDLWSFGQHLQPGTELRGELLRSAVNAMGCDLWSLENHCCLAALHLPYTSQEVSVAKDDDERYLRQLCIMAILSTFRHFPFFKVMAIWAATASILLVLPRRVASYGAADSMWAAKQCPVTGRG
eukprot:s3426_g1.t1